MNQLFSGCYRTFYDAVSTADTFGRRDHGYFNAPSPHLNAGISDSRNTAMTVGILVEIRLWDLWKGINANTYANTIAR
jgi:hypothetical protein